MQSLSWRIALWYGSVKGVTLSQDHQPWFVLLFLLLFCFICASIHIRIHLSLPANTVRVNSESPSRMPALPNIISIKNACCVWSLARQFGIFYCGPLPGIQSRCCILSIELELLLDCFEMKLILMWFWWIRVNAVAFILTRSGDLLIPTLIGCVDEKYVPMNLSFIITTVSIWNVNYYIAHTNTQECSINCIWSV